MNPLWTPSPERIAATRLTDFIKRASSHTGRSLDSYDDLHVWSVTEPANFWQFYADYAGLNLSALEQVISDDPMPQTRWFEGVTLNYAEQLLFPEKVSDKQTALIGVSETGAQESLTYAELRTEVARCAAALRREGVTVGDRVAALACNLPATTVLLLACSSLGAIFSSCSPDFGIEAAQARFEQIEPKVLFGQPFYYYGGKRFGSASTVLELANNIPSVQKTVFLPYVGEATPHMEGTSHMDGAAAWEDWLEPAAEPTLEPTFAQLPFDHPLYILYSSGTTGLPKAILHRQGGALLKHHSEQALHCDIRAGDVVFYFSTCGWMMWNWLVSALAQGATVIQYEGSPAQPDLGVLWRLAEQHGVNFFGTSARFIHSLQAQAVTPKDSADLSALRSLASTGSPLSASGFEFVYSHIKEDVHLASISGGTDIVGCFMLGVPTKPVYTGQIQGPALGADLAALNAAGKPLHGELGELVCRTPLPSMPLKFWNDPEGQRYFEAYFDVYEGLWRHGDIIEITEQGGVVVYGRSDATLNPSGVRIGTAELYRPLEMVPELVEACAVGKRDAGDEVIWLLVVLQEGVALNDTLKKDIKTLIRREASPRHVPSKIIQVRDLPRTRSGKLVEVAVSRLVNAQAIPNREVLANPEALDAIAALLEASA